MKHNFEFSYGEIILRPLQQWDIEQLRILRNRERKFFLSQKIISEEDQLRWYEKYCLNEDIMFKVDRQTDRQTICWCCSFI